MSFLCDCVYMCTCVVCNMDTHKTQYAIGGHQKAASLGLCPSLLPCMR